MRSVLQGAGIMLAMCCLFTISTGLLMGETNDGNRFRIQPDGKVTVAGLVFDDFVSYTQSDYFRDNGKRCGAAEKTLARGHLDDILKSTSDCTTSKTVIQSEYWPSSVKTIPIVFHIIHKTDGTGNISDQEVNDQVTVLNEDFRAKAGTMGSSGFDTKIQFQLAGITRTANNTWHNDSGESAYKAALGWDRDNYLNVYVNTAGGYLGYAYFPQGSAGSNLDGVVILYESVGGRNNGYSIYDQGRTLVHEIGHYLGLDHTFSGGCGSGYTAGDLIADTNPESTAHYSCVQTSTCGSNDPIHNYMNYTNDSCMDEFTSEQGNRAMCGLLNYRPQLSTSGGATPTLTVTSPNGGETLTVGNSHTITWSTTGTVGSVKIEYSTNNGSSWTTATSSTNNDGSYGWTVPNAVSSQCLVRIKEASDSSPSDTSNSVFSIQAPQVTNPTITVTSPNGGESWDSGTSHQITWTTTGSVGNVKIEYSLDNGGSWTSITTSTPNDGTSGWALPAANSSQCLVRVKEASDGSPSDTSNAVFSISNPTPASISLGRTQLEFGGDTGSRATSSQTVLIENNGGGTLNWSAVSDRSWLSFSPASGTASGVLNVSVNASGLSAGPYNGRVLISDSDADNSPQTISVTLTVYNQGTTSSPFGEFSTPTHGSTVSSSVPLTGWVLDDIEVTSVEIFSGSDFVGNAVPVEGSRPDVEQSYPAYPNNYNAGWGYMLLTHFLPGGGDGTYTLYAKAVDAEGNRVTLGSKTVTVNNSNTVKPFGAIDTPGQGGNAAGGSFVNWGWCLTPMPNTIPTNGSTIDVWVDGVNLGHPAYNVYRSDIATLFPGYNNSNGAVGYFYLDTTGYDNGVHSIQWTVKDDAGNTDGIGSRYFNIQNTGTRGGAAQSRETSGGIFKRPMPGNPLTRLKHKADAIPADGATPVRFKTGFLEKGGHQTAFPDDEGIIAIEIKELDRVEIHFGGPVINVSRLPIGSSLDSGGGVFYWQTGAGFTGNYQWVFLSIGENGEVRKVRLDINIIPKFSHRETNK
ncbi:MAG: hypothetical protein GY940_02180 [bacterium]|nr:hypothetical protein [bacterium]